MAEASGGIRDRARRAMRAELSALAIELFIERGFERTTVDEIAKAAGLSRRSFFRYFPSKEDVVFTDVELLGDQVIGELGTRPPQEDPWESLRQVLKSWARHIHDLGESAPHHRIIQATPALRARSDHRREELRQRIAATLRERPGADLTAFEADLLTGAANAALVAASRERTRGSEHDHGELVDRAFVALRPELRDARVQAG